MVDKENAEHKNELGIARKPIEKGEPQEKSGHNKPIATEVAADESARYVKPDKRPKL